jgi:hypothetical protein
MAASCTLYEDLLMDSCPRLALATLPPVKQVTVTPSNVLETQAPGNTEGCPTCTWGLGAEMPFAPLSQGHSPGTCHLCYLRTLCFQSQLTAGALIGLTALVFPPK